MTTSAPLRLEDAGQREDVPHVVLGDQDASPLEDRLAVARLAQHALLIGRQLGLDLVQEQRDLVEQALRRARALDDDRARVLARAAAPRPRSASAPVYTMTGGNAYALVGGHLLEQIVARAVGEREVGDDAVERARRASCSSASPTRAHARRSRRRPRRAGCAMLSRCRASSSTMSTRRTRRENWSSSLPERRERARRAATGLST